MRPIGLVLLTLLLAVVGCQPPVPDIGGQNNPAIVRKVVSLSPSTTEVVGLARGPVQLSGRTSACNFPFEVKDAPIVVSGTKPNYEMIATIKPDLILYDKALYSEADRQKIEQLGIRTLAMEASTIDGMLDYTLKVGAAVAGETALSKAVDEVVNARARAQAQALEPKPKVIVLMGTGGGGELMAPGTSSYLADVVRASGGDYVGPDGTAFVAVSPESLISWAPAIVFVPGRGDALLRDPRLATLPAVRARAVFEVDPDVLLRASPRVKDLIEAMASQIKLVGTR